MTKAKKTKEEVTPTSTFKPGTANVEAVLADKENAVPFVDENNPSTQPAIILPGNAFFDQELGTVIFDKLMKAPVKDYQVLLRLSKLGKTINDISHKLSSIRDAIAKDCELDKFIGAEASMTPETLNDPDYQAKSMAFGAMIQGYIFSKRISLAPLGTLTLDLTNPDGHAKAFLEGSNLSADDVDMLNSLGIVKVIYPDTVDEPAVPENNETLPAEEEKPTIVGYESMGEGTPQIVYSNGTRRDIQKGEKIPFTDITYGEEDALVPEKTEDEQN